MPKKKNQLSSINESVVSIIKNNKFFLIFVGVITFAVYANSLHGEFAVIDDYTTFIKSDYLRNLSANIQSLFIQRIFFSVLLNIFGLHPMPFHMLSVVLHLINIVLAFVVIHLLFGKRVSILSSLLFAVHSVNTEAIDWISGIPYLFTALFTFTTILTFILYKKTQQKKYLIYSVWTVVLALILIRTTWIFIIPMCVIVIDLLCLENVHITSKRLGLYTLYFIPVILFILLSFHADISSRLAAREVPSYMNQQSLKPVIESWPFTISSMVGLYVFPKDLTVYYDGNPITKMQYITMYITALLYLVTWIYFLKRNRAVSGLLLLLLVLLAPTFSPVKITWYISERYLYIGTAFFSCLIALGIFYIQDRFKWRYFAFMVGIILFCILSIRTFLRNSDWSTRKKLAEATIKTSPYSVRPYNDMGGIYKLEGDNEKALQYYYKALQINSNSNTAISNIGLIYLEVPSPQPYVTEDTEKALSLLKKGTSMYEQQQFPQAVFYLTTALQFDDNLVDARELLANIFLQAQAYKKAEEQFNWIIQRYPERYKIYERLAYIQYQLGDVSKSRQFLNRYLQFDPTNESVIQNLRILESIK